MNKGIIPEGVLSQHVAVLGKTGSGKTSTAKLLVEQVVPQGSRVCVLDPVKSDWWGLTSSADGKRPGLPFHILGGPRGHVPLHSGAGRAIGELVATGDLRHAIIDMADFEAGGLQRFFVDFAPALLRKMCGVVYLVVEEAHEFAPKERAGFGAENMAIHFAKKLATAGRSKGIRLVIVTQRVQSLHNALLGSCDTLIAHRITAPADQEPVVKWLKANATKDVVEMVSKGLSGLRTGSGWIVSGEAKLFHPVDFPRITTYDNTATPTDDDHRHEVATAPVDQDRLKAIIGEAVKEAEANDPKVLKAEIARLERDLRNSKVTSENQKPATSTGAVDIAAARQEGREEGAREGYAAGLRAVQPIAERLGTLASAVSETVEGFQQDLRRLAAAHPPPAPRPTPVPQVYVNRHTTPAKALKPNGSGTSSSEITGPQQRILDAAAFLQDTLRTTAPDVVQLALFAGQSATGGYWRRNIGRLRSLGLIEGTTLTADGRAAARASAIQTVAQLHEHILTNLLEGGQKPMFQALVDAYPDGLDDAELARRCKIEPAGGYWRRCIGRLRSLRLITKRGKKTALPVLFLER